MSKFREFDPNKIEINSKAVSPDYHPEPFYFVETSETGEIRMPCWSPDVASLAKIILEILKSFPKEVAVLVKARKDPSPAESEESDNWVRYHGYCGNVAVQNAFAKFRRFLLCDSTHQFMARNPDTGEYFAFDDCGILWIYSDDQRFQDLLVANGFRKTDRQPLISDGPVWRLTAPNSSGQLQELADFLMLDEVDAPERQDPPETIQ